MLSKAITNNIYIMESLTLLKAIIKNTYYIFVDVIESHDQRYIYIYYIFVDVIESHDQ